MSFIKLLLNTIIFINLSTYYFILTTKNMTKPTLYSKNYLFTRENVTVYLKIDCSNKLYTVGIQDAGVESAFTSTDNFEANIIAAELILDAVTFAKDEMKPEFTVE